MALFSRELGIDLGTTWIRVAEGNQIVLQEPTVAAIVVEEQKMVAWGQEAQDMLQGDALPHPAPAQHHHHLSALDLKTHVFQNRLLIKRLPDMRELGPLLA